MTDRNEHPGRDLRPRASALALGLLALGAAAPAGAQTPPVTLPGPVASAIAIQPVTHVVEQPPSGYFSDPYPIHLRASVAAVSPRLFSGTTKEILACFGSVQAGCVDAAAVTLSPGPLQDVARVNGSTITASENDNIYQDDAGAWHMATTLYVRSPAHPDVDHWNVIAHAHPTVPGVPTDWVADTLLVGSFSQPSKADYDGKYFEDSGTLYLLYSRRLSDTPARDGVVAQPMASPTQLAPGEPTTLLAPEDADGGYNSEYFFGLNSTSRFKLVETGNITRIDGKYAMAYSTGAYDEAGYKTGVAWSDTFLPAAGSSYKRMLRQDTFGVWAQPDHPEVQYLLQSQLAGWPNDVSAQVIAPGVPSILQDASGSWYLYFAGYAPSDAPILPSTGYLDPSHRRPFAVKLQVTIPEGATVAATPGADLAHWIAAASR